ncbi:pseudouridine synthase [Sphingopyxis sp.]|uniref:pseudouridine synthase n=1 Tax=Sphingopyxis sp. TaxID=1908224 RepID=UPI002638C44E|nr:pseudouridine synthase [Sphingopyxis sp.]MCW0199701.1 rRNA pseudouridine synthase [Sphingopyxis sp.]
MLLPENAASVGRTYIMSRHDSWQGAPRSATRRIQPPFHPATIVSLPRALSKLGYCSRTEALALIEAGRVLVDGRPARAASQRVDMARAVIVVDGAKITAQDKVYLMLNKPRGLVTTRRDPRQRDTVYDCLPDGLPFLSPVGRLDKASEGLLLLTNDTQWAEQLMNPASGVPKTYHVKIDRVADERFVSALSEPVEDDGERLSAASVGLLRTSGRSSWIEIVLTEGRNRQVRRMVASQGANVLRLVRVAIGGVSLGDLTKGQVRSLAPNERVDLQLSCS